MNSGMTWTGLGGMAACGLALLLMSEDFRKSVAPMRQRQAEALHDAAELRERIADAEKAIAEVRARETDAERIRGEIDQVQASLPSGTATVSFPAWVKGHFAYSGIVVSMVRLNAAQDEPNASGYERGFWSVDLPMDEAGRSASKMLEAVADMDRQGSFVRVLDFEIRSAPGKPGGRVGLLNLATVLRK